MVREGTQLTNGSRAWLVRGRLACKPNSLFTVDCTTTLSIGRCQYQCALTTEYNMEWWGVVCKKTLDTLSLKMEVVHLCLVTWGQACKHSHPQFISIQPWAELMPAMHMTSGRCSGGRKQSSSLSLCASSSLNLQHSKPTELQILSVLFLCRMPLSLQNAHVNALFILFCLKKFPACSPKLPYVGERFWTSYVSSLWLSTGACGCSELRRWSYSSRVSGRSELCFWLRFTLVNFHIAVLGMVGLRLFRSHPSVLKGVVTMHRGHATAVVPSV